MGPLIKGPMDPHWLKLRWPITVFALGAMLIGVLVRSSQHPIQLRLVLSFAEPLNLAGQVEGVLSMPNGVKIEPASSVRVRVTEQAPIDLSVNNTTPVKVEVSNPEPIEIKMSEEAPMEVDVDPKAPVNVKIGL
jgi:hypothetical protein